MGMRRSGPASLLALALLSTPLAAREGELAFDRLSVEDGLSHSTVNVILQDRLGFLWIGTQDGLNRYDGYRFKIYEHDPEKPWSLSENEIWAIHEDHRGELWIGTFGGGLARFRRADESFESFRHDPGATASLSHDIVMALAEDRDGTLWIGTEDGLDRFDAERRVIRRMPAPDGPAESLTINCLLADRADGVWAGTSDGLYRVDRPAGTLVRYRSEAAGTGLDRGAAIFSLAEDRDGHLWIATAGEGLKRLDPRTGELAWYRHDPADPATLAEDTVFILHVGRAGELRLGTESRGLSRFDPERGTFDHTRHDSFDPSSLSDNGVRAIYEDRTGLLWIGTFGGLNKADPARRRFVTWHHRPGRRPGLSGNGVSSVTEDRAGALWIGTYDEGLDRLDDRHRRPRVVHYPADPADPASLPHGTVSALCEDASGTLWVGTWDGLSRLDRERGRFTTYRHRPDDPSSLRSSVILALFADGSGRLWIGTDSGLHRLDGGPPEKGGRLVRFPVAPDQPPSLGQTPIYAIHEDRGGALWLGSDRDGLYRLDPAVRRVDHFRHDADDPFSPSSDKIATIYADRSGTVWIGTYGGGLDRHEGDGRFHHYRERDGLPNDTVLGVLEDDLGRLWLSTNQGLSRFDPRTGTFRNYDADDGLQGNVFSTGAAFASPGGELLFGGVRGLTAFYPDDVVDDPHPPAVVITELQLFNRPAPLRSVDPGSPLARSILTTDELTLSHRDYVFGFEFAALHFAKPRKNRYAYRLQGFDREWIATDAGRRFAQYSNLDAGKYVFRVRASNGDGVWNDDGATLRVVVLPPPWKTWWAYLLYALALAGVVVGYVRWQSARVERERTISRRLREVDRLKDEFLANTSHELRTPLYGIIGLAESLIDGATGELPPATRANLSSIVASGRRLSGLVNDILDFSRLTRKSLELDRRPVDLETLADVVIQLSRPLIDGKELELVNAVGSDLPPADADENRVQQILHNLIGNAIKFTERGRIEVSAVAEEGRLVVRVSDTGIGIPEDRRERIFEAFEQADAAIDRAYSGTGLGLAVTKQLVELHGGNLWVDSLPGQGSTFFFTLPISAEKLDATRALDELISRPLLADDEVAQPERPPTDAGGETAGGESLLIVDDDPVIRQVLRNHLTGRGYRLVEAVSGQQALQLLEDEGFDLVLLDVMMPKLSGFEVCRVLRRRHPPDELPVIFLTAKNRVSDLVSGFAAGANDYLTKPIAKNELLARVEAHLSLLATRRRLARLLAERERQIAERQKLVEELRASNAELARFTYTVSHDLKSPLVTILGFLGLVEKDAEAGDHDRLRHDVERIRSAAQTMQRLLEDLLELSRIGRMVNPPQRIAMSELASEAVRLVAGAIAERRVEVVVDNRLPAVAGDRVRLLQVLQNLLDNAIKYMGDQPSPKVEVTTEARDGETVFQVRDNGRGIAPEDQERIFGLFQRLKAEGDGTGIGLALVQRIVEHHGGRVWVESEGPGRGSTFCFTLATDIAPARS